MILKLGMKHQAMELYKICINCDPRMTLTYFMSQSTLVTHAFEWINFVNCYLKRKTCSKLANGLKFYDLKKKFTPGVALTRPGVIYMYTPRITCYRELGGSGNSEVNNGRQIRLGAAFILFYFQFTSTLEFNISHIQSLEDEAPACTISLS